MDFREAGKVSEQYNAYILFYCENLYFIHLAVHLWRYTVDVGSRFSFLFHIVKKCLPKEIFGYQYNYINE